MVLLIGLRRLLTLGMLFSRLLLRMIIRVEIRKILVVVLRVRRLSLVKVGKVFRVSLLRLLIRLRMDLGNRLFLLNRLLLLLWCLLEVLLCPIV